MRLERLERPKFLHQNCTKNADSNHGTVPRPEVALHHGIRSENFLVDLRVMLMINEFLECPFLTLCYSLDAAGVNGISLSISDIVNNVP